MIRAALLLLCLATPAAAPEAWTGWRSCSTDSDCETRTALACINGDKAACVVARETHREECRATPGHEDCAEFRAED